MGRTSRSLFVLLSFVFSESVCISTVPADDWPRFRGPHGNGVSSSKLPISWTPTANLGWKSELPGPGVSSPIVVQGKVFVTCYSGYGLDRNNPGDIKDLVRHLICFDAESGQKLWQKDVPAALPEDPYSGIGVPAHGYASHTPASDGERVYAYFGKSGAYAFDLNGNQLWHTSVGTESDPWAWGSSSSPIVYNNLMIVTASAESQAIVGLDKETGKEVWRQEAAGLDGMWGTPILVTIDDTRTDLVMSVPKEMWGLDPTTGKLRWHSQATGAEQTHSSAIADGDKIIAFTGRGGGSVAIRAGGQGDVSESNVIWSGRDSARFGSPVSYQSKVYLVANGILTVLDEESGKKLGQARLQGGSGGGGGGFGSSDYASPVIADGKLYFLKGNGEMFVFKLGDSPEQISLNLVATDNETFGGTPAISDGRMFIRSDKNLYCIMQTQDDVEPNASANLIAKADPQAEDQRGGRGGPGGRGGGRGGFGGGGFGGGGGGRPNFDPASFFSRIDSNDDKKLTLDELEGNPMASRFGDLDTNQDKSLSLDEFQAGLRSMFSGGRGGAGGGRGGFGGGGGERPDNRPERPQRPESSGS